MKKHITIPLSELFERLRDKGKYKPSRYQQKKRKKKK